MAQQQVIVVTNGDGNAQRFVLRNSMILKFERQQGTSWGATANSDGFKMAYWCTHKRWPTEAELAVWVDTVTFEALNEDVPEGDENPTDPALAPSS